MNFFQNYMESILKTFFVQQKEFSTLPKIPDQLFSKFGYLQKQTIGQYCVLFR